jgi:uncharacterized protein
MMVKKLLISCSVFLAVLQISAQFTIPKKPPLDKQRGVYDYAAVFTEQQSSELVAWLKGYADSTSTQIVVITIASAKGENLGLLAPRWGHEWGIGQKKEDNGVIMLIDMGGREIWISPGYGLEDKLPAGITGEIVRNTILPFFKKGQYYEGVLAGLNEIVERIAGTYVAKDKKKEDNGAWVLFVILGIVIIFFFLAKKGGGNGGPGSGRRRGFDATDAIIFGSMGRGMSRGGSSFGGGFGSGGGFSGGFGGGGFSGGGAGGSW